MSADCLTGHRSGPCAARGQRPQGTNRGQRPQGTNRGQRPQGTKTKEAIRVARAMASSSNGGADGCRTHDLWSAIPALSQLSYSPVRDVGFWCKAELCSWPAPSPCCHGSFAGYRPVPLTRPSSAECSDVQRCPGTELNRRHGDFQSPALPTELPGRQSCGAGWRRGRAECGRSAPVSSAPVAPKQEAAARRTGRLRSAAA